MKSFFYTLALVTALAALCPAQLITSVASQCATSTDGTVVGTPNPLNPPQVSAVYTGTLPAGNYYVVESWYDALSNTTLVGPEVQIQLTGTGEIQEMPPASGLPNTVSGRNIYISTASGTETLQGSAPVAATYVQSVPLVTGVAVPAVNSTVCQVIANDSGWPTGTGYSVDFTTTAGDTLPGYPMQWQLLGPGNTINLSSGLPLYNGTVTYPSPILAIPYNHGTQSISGPLSLGGYGLSLGTLSSSTTPSYTANGVTDVMSVFLDGYNEGGLDPATNAISVGGITPSNATVINVTGISTRMTSNCNSVSRTICNTVGGYFVGNAFSNGAGVWGNNQIVQDAVGVSGAQLIGAEIDMGIYGTPAFSRGLVILPSGTGTPASDSIGIEIGGAISGGQSAFVRGLQVDDGSSSLYGIQVGAILPSGTSLASMPLAFARFDSGGVRHTDVTAKADSSGDFVLTPTSGAGINIGGALSFTVSNMLNFLGTAHSTSISVPDPTGTRAINLPDSGAINTNIGLSLNTSNGTYASGTVAGCTTGGTAGNACASAVTLSLPASFADTAYDAGCNPRGAPTNFPSAPYVVAKSAGSFTVNYIANTSAAASWPNLDCWAIHH